MKQFALMFVLAGCVGVGCNPVKAADPEPTGVKSQALPAEVAPAAVPAAAPAAAPAAVPAEIAPVPVAAGAVEPAADGKAIPKSASTSIQPKGKSAARSDAPPRVSKKGGGVTSF